MENPRNQNSKGDFEYYDAPLFHPAKVVITLLLTSLTMLFLFLTLSYLYTRIEQGIEPIYIPIIFVLNTLVLVGTSYMIHRANICYKMDDTEGYQNSLLWTIALTFLFMGLQAVGFYQLIASNEAYFSATDNARSYLQIISILHLVHVLAGLPFLIIFYTTAKKRMIEPVSVLVYFSDPIKKMRLNLLSIYWHFLDALWIYLVLFFWLNYLIR